MRKNTQIFMLLVVILGFVGIYYTEYKEKKKEESKYAQLSFNPTAFEKLEISGDNILTITRSKEDFLVNQRPADKKYLTELFDSLQNTSFEKVPLQGGLPGTSVSVRLDGTQLISLSKMKTFEGQSYYTFGGGFYTANTDLVDLLLKPAIYFQDKHLFKHDIDQFSKIKIKSLNENFVLNAPFDKVKVGTLINKLQAMTVQEYLDQVSFENPLLEIDLSGQKNWHMKLSLNKFQKKLFAKVNDTFCEFDTSYWEFFANLNQEQFRKDKP